MDADERKMGGKKRKAETGKFNREMRKERRGMVFEPFAFAEASAFATVGADAGRNVPRTGDGGLDRAFSPWLFVGPGTWGEGPRLV